VSRRRGGEGEEAVNGPAGVQFPGACRQRCLAQQCPDLQVLDHQAVEELEGFAGVVDGQYPLGREVRQVSLDDRPGGVASVRQQCASELR